MPKVKQQFGQYMTPKIIVDFINVEVENRFHFKNIYYQKASPAISADCGPGTFGVIYMTK